MSRFLLNEMRKTRSVWEMRRIKHRDAVVLSVLSSSFLMAGEFTVPVMQEIYIHYLQPVQTNALTFAFRTLLAVFAFTTALGAILVLLGGWFFMQDRIGKGRFLVGFGVGLTSLSLLSKVAYATLVEGTPLAFLIPLATSLTGVGVLLGVMTHTTMGRHALFVKGRMRQAFRRWRRGRRGRVPGDERSPMSRMD